MNLSLMKRTGLEPEWLGEIDGFENRLRKLLGRGFWAEPDAVGFIPAVEMTEGEKEYVLSAELPGVKREDVELSIEGNTLTLKGEKKDVREEKTARYVAWERSYGGFERCFTLPRAVDPAGIKAEFEDGIMTVHLPKSEEARGRRIEIATRK